MQSEEWIAYELDGVDLPDARYRENLLQIGHSLSQNIAASFSAACGERLRKCGWRLFSYKDLDLLSTHRERTLHPCAGHQTIIVIEDTTCNNHL